jgi:hypothetical protein
MNYPGNLISGIRNLYSVLCILSSDIKLRVAGFWILDAGCSMLDTGCWMLDAGCWILDAGYQVSIIGCFGIESITGVRMFKSFKD